MDFQELFEITVNLKHRRHTSYVGYECALCGRIVSPKEDEIRIIIHSEDYLHYDHTGEVKTIRLLKRSDWWEDYDENGEFSTVGKTCAKKIPKEYKETVP